MKYQDMTCGEFNELLASKAPVPGGGGASALVGAVGTALGSMVGGLTVGKKKYENVEEDIIMLMDKAEAIRKELLLLIDQDAEMFEPLSRAYRLPKETPKEIESRAVIMEQALKDACTVPLKIMEKCCEAIELNNEFAAKGSVLAISDAGCGSLFCKAALQGASLNVFINTKLMTDRNYAEDINCKAESMLEHYVKLADDIFKSVRIRL